MLADVNEIITQKALKSAGKSTKTKTGTDIHNKPDSPGPSGNQGKLIVDATCAPADITFPTDLKLLNEARKKSERIIDILHTPFKGKQKKPRTYRKKARKDFLSAAKSKTLSRRKRRKAIRKQLNYLERDLKIIEKLSAQTSLTVLTSRQYKNLLVINEVYRQQKLMHDNRKNRIDNRIVNISQPHVRPIKRGKAGATTEFGAKISISLVDGFTYIDRVSWDNYNEATDLINQIEKYRNRFGFYPESVHADKIYRNRENRDFCKKHDIRLSGPPLGRPSKKVVSQIEKQARQDELDRIPVEGKFGQAKRRFSLAKIMCKLAQTSETAISIVFIVLNIEKWLKAILFYLFFSGTSEIFSGVLLKYIDFMKTEKYNKCILAIPNFDNSSILIG